MWITVANLESYVTRFDGKELAWLDNFLSFPDSTAYFRRARSAFVSLLNPITHRFPSGLLPIVLAGAKEENIPVELLDTRKPPAVRDPNADTSWLRDYQTEALELCITTGRGIVQAPTGSGKTEIFVALGHALPVQWLITVSRKDLMHQAAERFNERMKDRGGETAGIIGDGHFKPARFTVAMFQSLYAGLRKKDPRVLELLRNTIGFACDEVHGIPADSSYRVAMAMPNAFWRLGFSGTPLARGDRKGLLAIATTGPVIYRITADKLVEQGVIARAMIRMVHHKTRATDHTDWHEAYSDLVVYDAERNARVVRSVQRAAKPSLVFVRELEHGKQLVKALTAAGTSCEFVFGGHNTPQRKSAIQRLQRADIDVLICNVIFQEGVDIPELMSVVNAAGGKSVIACIQDAGRGMRRFDVHGREVKTEFEVYDFLDTHCGCRPSNSVSYDHRACRWMADHARARKRAYLGERYEVTELTL